MAKNERSIGIPEAVPVLTVEDMAEFFRVSEKTIRRLVQEKRLPAPVMVGKQLRWPKPVIDAWCRGE